MKRRLTPLALAAAVLLAAAQFISVPRAPAEDRLAQPVSLKPEVVIDGATLTLGDLFNGLGARAGTAVAQAPEPGGRIRLSAQWLQRLARAYALAWQPQPGFAGITVERSSQTVGGEEIAAALREALNRQGLGDNRDIVLDRPSLTLNLPAGLPPVIEVTSLSFDPRSERVAARIQATGEGEYRVRTLVRGRALLMTEIPVLRHQMGNSQVITRRDLEWRRVPTARLGHQTLTDPAEILGQSPRRSLRPGRPLRANDLQVPVVVARNSLVTLRLQTPFMRLTAQGRALEDGALGEVVRITNIKSKAVVHGVVTAPNTVLVTGSTQEIPYQEASR